MSLSFSAGHGPGNVTASSKTQVSSSAAAAGGQAHLPLHHESPMTAASQVPLPASAPSTPVRRRRKERENDDDDAAVSVSSSSTGEDHHHHYHHAATREATPGKKKRVVQPAVAQEKGEAVFAAVSSTSAGEDASSSSLSPLSAAGAVPSSGTTVKVLPYAYMQADSDDLVILIASMLSKLIAHNDQVPLLPEHLTRFHSRAPPAISVIEYLKRIVKYTNIEKSPLLLLLPYLDAFCIQLPTFTLSSLTVHRFLITSACIASKALCDQFCTNQHYAKVGGIRVAELNLLERELIAGLGWRLVTEEALLQSYYASLITSYAAHQGHSSAASGETPRVVYVQGPPPPPAPPPPPPSYLPWPSIKCFEAGTFSGESSAEQI